MFRIIILLALFHIFISLFIWCDYAQEIINQRRNEINIFINQIK
ncbi:MAG: hypothetical protein ACRCXT_17985 [Paraclostridium sp.]